MSEDVKFCGNCGARLRPGSRFCVDCGTTVTAYDTTAAQPAAPPLDEQETVAVPADAAPSWAGGAAPPPAAPASAPGRAPSRRPVWLLPALVALGVVVLGAIAFGAYSFLGGEDDLSIEAAMAQGATDDFRPVNPTTSFSPDAEVFHLTFSVKGAEPGSEVRSIWYAVNVGNAAPPDTKIDEATVTLTNSDDRGTFRLRRGRNPWPTGDYKVELFVDGELMETLPFTVAR